jgi:hypothetical protein
VKFCKRKKKNATPTPPPNLMIYICLGYGLCFMMGKTSQIRDILDKVVCMWVLFHNFWINEAKVIEFKMIFVFENQFKYV